MSETDNPKCAICGRPFTPKRKNSVTCSKECAFANSRRWTALWRADHPAAVQAANAHRNAKERAKTLSLAKAHRAGSLPTMHTLATAKRKPAGVSAVRWRIELRRRASAEAFGYAQDPERLR